MRTIAFVTQTGGAGKSTLVASLAVAARERSETVGVVDLDPRGLLTHWARTRGASDITVAASGAARLRAALAELSGSGCTLAIIDAPGVEGLASSCAIAAADLTIIPSRPSLFDLRASASTSAAVAEIGGAFAFLLNQCPSEAQSPRARDGAERLKELGVVLAPLILARVDYPEAARRGLGVTELNPEGDAADEMRTLWTSIRRRLARVRQRSAARRAA